MIPQKPSDVTVNALAPTNDELAFLSKNEIRINRTIIFALDLLSGHYSSLNDPGYVKGSIKPIDILSPEEIYKLRGIQNKLIENAKRRDRIEGPR